MLELATPVATTAEKTETAPIELLMVSLNFHPEPTGTAAPIADLTWWLAENGHDVRVAAARPHYPEGRVFDGYRRGARDRETVNDAAVRRFAIPVSAKRGMLQRLASELTFALQLLRARLTGGVAPAPYVISVSPSIFNVAMAALFRRRGGRFLVIVYDIQSSLGASLAMGLGGVLLQGLRRVERYAFNRADVIVTLSEAMEQSLRELGVHAPVHILPPQIDIKEFDPAPAPADMPPTVVYSGNFGRKQGLEQVLRMASVLAERGHPARIVLRGDGDQRAGLQALKAELGLTNVAFEPLVPREQLAASFAAGLVHLIPQIPDGGDFAVPSKAFSIMAAARPFVCTALPGSSLDTLARSTNAGLSVPPDDPVAFADAVAALLADPERRARMGAAGRAYAAAHADREVICAEMLRLLRASN